MIFWCILGGLTAMRTLGNVARARQEARLAVMVAMEQQKRIQELQKHVKELEKGRSWK